MRKQIIFGLVAAAAMMVVILVAQTTSNPAKYGMMTSSDGSGTPGTWAPLTGTGTPYTGGSVTPAGLMVSTDGTGNPGTWVAATPSTFSGGGALLASNNTWTGTNTFNNVVTISSLKMGANTIIPTGVTGYLPCTGSACVMAITPLSTSTPPSLDTAFQVNATAPISGALGNGISLYTQTGRTDGYALGNHAGAFYQDFINSTDVSGFKFCSYTAGTALSATTSLTCHTLANPAANSVIASSVSTVVVGKATCWKTATTIGYCSTQPDSTGSCTCN